MNSAVDVERFAGVDFQVHVVEHGVLKYRDGAEPNRLGDGGRMGWSLIQRHGSGGNHAVLSVATQPGELGKIASGGEMSRVMLAVKSLISQRKLLPTLIFDEIDTGVSGDIAGKVGNIMRRMSNSLQLIAITHLPQIAGMSDNHYLVYKELDNGLTTTSIRMLTKDERITEIAKMLSNETVTEAALATAKELLFNN